jgi:hypothetical protein
MSWHAQLYRPLKPRDHAPTKADGPFMPHSLLRFLVRASFEGCARARPPQDGDGLDRAERMIL